MNFSRLIIKLFNKKLYNSIKFSEKVQYADESFLNELREKKFKKLLTHVRENVPYFENKINDVNDINDIKKIDFLTKKVIKENLAELKPLNFTKSRFIENSTSGSTGDSTFFYSDSLNYNLKAAAFRGDSWAGLNIGDKAVYLWGAERDIVKDVSFKKKLKDQLVSKIKILSTYHMSDEDLDNYVETINTFRPKTIVSYPTPLYHFAKYILDNNILIRKPKSIITSAETLFPFQRELIESVFECKIYNRYGCREVGMIAAECSEFNGLHYNYDRFIIEIINEKGEECKEGEKGEIVITDLDNYVFPFLRYKIGDIAIKTSKKCNCGVNFPLLQEIEGRVFDVIKGTNGNTVAGTFWTLLRNKIKGWEKFQIIQESRSELKVIVEDNESIDDTFEDAVRGIIAEKLGQDLKVTINIIDRIPLTKTGKHRWIISNI